VTQRSLFKHKITQWITTNNEGEDNLGIAVLDNGEACLIKCNKSDNPYQCANEWLCCHLSRKCGIPAPTAYIVTFEGVDMIAIRMETDVLEDINQKNIPLLLDKVKYMMQQKEILSRIAMFDIITMNIDRHLNNFLVRHTSYHTNIMAIDYGRALFYNDFQPVEFNNVKQSSTGNTWMYIAGGDTSWLDLSEASIIAKAFKGIDAAWFEQCLDEMPTTWIPDNVRRDIIYRFRYLRNNCVDKAYQDLEKWRRS